MFQNVFRNILCYVIYGLEYTRSRMLWNILKISRGRNIQPLYLQMHAHQEKTSIKWKIF